MGPALLTFVSEEHQYAQIGESTRFFCEAYIGYGAINYSEVTWLLINEDNVTDFPKTEDGRRYVEQVQREKSVIIGEYLYFKSVHEEDYRTYICKIHKGDTPKLYNVTLIKGDNPLTKYVPTYKRTSLIIVVFTVFVVVSFFVYQKWKFELRLYWKDHFGKLEDDDKDYDVFVCYDQADADFALGVLVHTLEEVYTYKCFAYERDSIAGDWVPEIYSKKIRECRRFVMVLSPDLAVNSWCIYALYVAIEAMLNLHSKIICVVLQDIPWDRLEPTSETKDCTLQQVMRVVQKVYWKPPEKKEEVFFYFKDIKFSK